MKFYPLRNWQSGQPTVLIDGNTYYTLESATEWEITEAEEHIVTIAAHKGEEWIKKRELQKRKPAMEKGPTRSGEDREWIKEMLTKTSTRIVSQEDEITKTPTAPQKEEVVIVAPTPLGHQDAGTIKLDQEARKAAEREKVATAEGKKGSKGKGKARTPPPAMRTSPPVTRARKRARQTTATDSRTASQDSCTPRNPLQDGAPRDPHHTSPHEQTFLAGTQDRHLGLDDPATPTRNNPFRPSEGYTPPRGYTETPPGGHSETETGLIGTTLFKKLLEKLPDFPRSSRRAIWGLIELVREGALEPSLEELRESDPETMEKATLACLTDDREDLTLDSKASRGDVLKIRDEISVQYQVVAKNLARIEKLKEDSIRLFKAHQKETREARREEKEILSAAMEDVKTLNKLLREKKENPPSGLIKELQSISAKLNRVEEHWDGLMTHIQGRGDPSNFTSSTLTSSISGPTGTPETQPETNPDPRRQLPQIPIARNSPEVETVEITMPDAEEVVTETEARGQDPAGLQLRTEMAQSTSKTQRPPGTTNRKMRKTTPKGKNVAAPTWSPAVAPDPQLDAEALGIDKAGVLGNAADNPVVIQSQTQPEREAKLKDHIPKLGKKTGWKPASISDETDEEGTNGAKKESRKPTAIPNPPEPTQETLPIQILLRDIMRKINQVHDDTTPPPDPSQWIWWDTNGTHPDNAPRLSETIKRDKAARREAQKIGHPGYNRKTGKGDTRSPDTSNPALQPIPQLPQNRERKQKEAGTRQEQG